jgi:hypothetical protein
VYSWLRATYITLFGLEEYNLVFVFPYWK